MGLGATEIYFGNRMCSGVGDPQNVSPSLNLYISTCELDLIWKMVFAEGHSPSYLSPCLLSPA